MVHKDWKRIAKHQWEKQISILEEGAMQEPYLVEINSYSSPTQPKKTSYEVRVWSLTENILEEKKFSTLSLASKWVKSFMGRN